MMRWLSLFTTGLKCFAVAAVGFGLGAGDAKASFISQADFTNPVLYDLSNLGEAGAFSLLDLMTRPV
jgi:hypothetical protein